MAGPEALRRRPPKFDTCGASRQVASTLVYGARRLARPRAAQETRVLSLLAHSKPVANPVALEQAASLVARAAVKFLVTHVQLDEIYETPDEARRNDLLRIVAQLRAERLPQTGLSSASLDLAKRLCPQPEELQPITQSRAATGGTLKMPS